MTKARFCVACGHEDHGKECSRRLPWWRRWLSGLQTCGCTYNKPPEVEKGYCDYPKCVSRIGNDWDTRCYEHSWRVDGGRP